MIPRPFAVALLATLLVVWNGIGRGDGSGHTDGTVTSGRSTGTTAVPPENPGAGAGVLRGKVLFQGNPPAPEKLLIVKDVAVCGKTTHTDERLIVGKGGGIRNAVVSVVGVKNGKQPRTSGRDFVLEQKSCSYVPHVLLLPVGATLRILNEDGVLHNIHSFSTLNKPFNIAQPKILRELKRSFTVPERIALRCDVHGWMNAWVIVTGDAYQALTDDEGNFEISGIPPGRYTVKCWQEELGEQSAEITVGNEAAAHDFVYTKDHPPTRIN
jgi:hypothetical protein